MTRPARNERGMTLIEVSVTILVICLGTLATLGTYTHFVKATRKSRERAVLVSVAQREMEALRPISFANLGLSGPPPAQATADAPREGPAASEQLVYSGVVNPGGDEYTYRGAHFRVYRYVTKRDLVCGDLTAKVHGQLATRFSQATTELQTTVPNLCGVASTTKRITVVIVPINESGVVTTGVRLTTIVQDPSSITPAAVNSATLRLKRVTDTAAATPTPGAAAVTQTLALTDTRCSQGARGTPSSHQTSDTAQTGFTCGVSGPAPTLMTLAGIPGSDSDPLYDFSTDVTRTATNGLAMLRDDRPGCGSSSDNVVYTNPEAATRRFAIHQWASRPPTTGVGFETPDSGGRASVTLWASTAQGTESPGRVCLTLRDSNGRTLGRSDLSLATWPDKPTELVAAFDVDHLAAVSAADFLVLTVRVPQDSGSDIRILYDHPKYQSSLSVSFKSGKTL